MSSEVDVLPFQQDVPSVSARKLHDCQSSNFLMDRCGSSLPPLHILFNVFSALTTTSHNSVFSFTFTGSQRPFPSFPPLTHPFGQANSLSNCHENQGSVSLLNTPPINLVAPGKASASSNTSSAERSICDQPFEIRVEMLVPKMHSLKPDQRIAEAH